MLRTIRYFSLLGLLIVGPTRAQDSLNVRHLFHWDDPSIPGSSDFANQYNEVWGHAADGREYAIIGSTLGTHIFDVTVPEASVEVDFIAGRYAGSNVIHRDYKTYEGRLYAVCDEGPSSLQIMDLSYLPDSVHVVYDSNVLFNRAHNIQIDSVNARLYTCGGTTPFSVYSIADPDAPVLLGHVTFMNYVHDCYVRDNIVWLNRGNNALSILDLTDVNAPVLLGGLNGYPGQGYNHSGWLNDDGTVYAMVDETHGSPIKLIDASDIGDLNVLSLLSSGVTSNSIVHNPFFNGDLLHVAYYYDGYWLWNTTDPAQPTLLGYYDTSMEPNNDSYKGAWGVYPYLPSGRILVSDMQTGLWVLDIDQATGGVGTEEPPLYRIAPTLTDGPLRITPIGTMEVPMLVVVMDASGKQMRSWTEPSRGIVELDLGTFADGLYLVVVSDGAKRYGQRIIKSSK